MPNTSYHEINRLSWNAATIQHNTHRGDRAKFFREGGNTLFPEEIELLGDIRGKSLGHLQCNGGLDTLSIVSHMGAVVTGVDISDTAIDAAITLSKEAEIPATFIRSDLYDWFDQNTTEFDVVFTSYGTIGWLSDIVAWGQGVASALKPGGRFVFVEFHPFVSVFDDDGALKYDYGSGAMTEWDDGVGDYIGEAVGSTTDTGTKAQSVQPFVNPHPSVEFSWGVADIVMALITAGLKLTFIREYPYSNAFQSMPGMREIEGRRMIPGEGQPNMPLMLAIVAEKPE